MTNKTCILNLNKQSFNNEQNCRYFWQFAILKSTKSVQVWSEQSCDYSKNEDCENAQTVDQSRNMFLVMIAKTHPYLYIGPTKS